jgi:hypothetical protein
MDELSFRNNLKGSDSGLVWIYLEGLRKLRRISVRRADIPVGIQTENFIIRVKSIILTPTSSIQSI